MADAVERADPDREGAVELRRGGRPQLDLSDGREPPGSRRDRPARNRVVGLDDLAVCPRLGKVDAGSERHVEPRKRVRGAERNPLAHLVREPLRVAVEVAGRARPLAEGAGAEERVERRDVGERLAKRVAGRRVGEGVPNGGVVAQADLLPPAVVATPAEGEAALLGERELWKLGLRAVGLEVLRHLPRQLQRAPDRRPLLAVADRRVGGGADLVGDGLRGLAQARSA